MDDRKNTIAMMVLAAGIVALGGSIATGEFFHAERPEKMGYVVEGVEVEGEGGGEARTCGAPSASRTAMSQASPIRTR
jgi:cytochrome c